jgi:PST family polysaccharide transporter
MKSKPRGLREGSLSGFVWSLGGSGAQAVLRVAVLAVLARLLTPEDFGLLGAALIVVGLSEIFCFIGVAPSIVQRSELEPRHVETAWTISLLFGIATTVIIYACAPLVGSFFRMKELIPVVQLTSLVFTFHGVSLVGRALLQRNLQFKILAICEFAAFLVYAIVGIVFALLDYGVSALVAAYLSAAAASTLLILSIQRHEMGFRIDSSACRELLGFGIGMSLNNLLNYLARQGDNLVVGRWLGSSALGAYGRAYALMAAPVAIAGQVMDTVLFASVARVQRDKPKMGRAFRSVTTVVAVKTLPVSALCLISAPEMIYVLLGPKWSLVVAPFRVLALGMFFRVAYKIGGAVNRGVGAVYRMAWRQAVYAAVILGGSLIAQYWGLSAVAFAVFLGLAIAYILSTGLTLSLLDIGWDELGILLSAPLLLSIVSALPAWVVVSAARAVGMPSIVSLLLTGLAWALALQIMLRVRAAWFVDSYTYGILRDMSARIPLASSVLSWVLPLESVVPGASERIDVVEHPSQ